MIRGVIFDLDDTLYDYQSLEETARKVAEVYAEEKLQIPRQAFAKAFEKGRNLVKRQLPNTAAGHSRLLYYQKTLEELNYQPLSAALELEDRYWNYFLENIKKREGVEPLLTWMKEMGWKIGICTDLTAQIQLQKIRKLGLEQWTSCIVTSEEAGVEKPHPEIFCLCLEKMQLSSQEVFMVGDSISRDMEGAKKLGIQTVWYVRKDFETGSYKDGSYDGICISSFYDWMEELKHGIL